MIATDLGFLNLAFLKVSHRVIESDEGNQEATTKCGEVRNYYWVQPDSLFALCPECK